MSRLELPTPSKAQLVVEGLYKDLEQAPKVLYLFLKR